MQHNRIRLWPYVKKLALIGSFTVITIRGYALIHPQQIQADKTIKELYHILNQLPKLSMTARLDWFSKQFIEKKYVLGALGEGANARYDQEPRYRVDAFDCDTYVTTVLALALAKDNQVFKKCLSKVRYKNGKVGFLTRNHFMSLDWNLNNRQQGFIKDITDSIKNQKGKSIAKIASAIIDKPSWYNHFTTKTIRLQSNNPALAASRLAELKQKGNKLEIKKAEIPYLPLNKLLDRQGQANKYLFDQIPNGAIVEIVRPNWNLREQIGTHLNVSHLGFVFWKKNIPYFRQASSQYGKVISIPLIDYLRAAKGSPTIRGINVQIVIPINPLSIDCKAPNS